MRNRSALCCLLLVVLKLAGTTGCHAGPSRPKKEEGGASLGGALAVYPELSPPPEEESGGQAKDNPWLDFGENSPPNADPSGQEPGSDAGSSGGATAGDGAGGSTISTGGAGGSRTGLTEPAPTGAEADGGAMSEGAPEAPPTPPVMLLRGYYESTNSAKMLIVDHIAGGPTDDCAVEIYSNGGAEPWRTLALPEATERGLRHVLCVPEAHHPACTAVFGGSAFNGNDALRLRCGAVTQDLFGVIGSDPGTEWTGIGIAGISIGTADQGLWRCLDPTPEQTPSFELSEWTAWDPSGDPSLLAPDCVDPSGQDGAGGWAGAGSAESFD